MPTPSLVVGGGGGDALSHRHSERPGFERWIAARVSPRPRMFTHSASRSVKSNTPDGPVDCAKELFAVLFSVCDGDRAEVFLVANFLRHEYPERLPQILDRMRNADRDTRYVDYARRLSMRLPCPLLADGACSVYAARPSACRSLVSSSLSACRRGAGRCANPPSRKCSVETARRATQALHAPSASSGQGRRVAADNTYRVSRLTAHLILRQAFEMFMPQKNHHFRRGHAAENSTAAMTPPAPSAA